MKFQPGDICLLHKGKHQDSESWIASFFGKEVLVVCAVHTPPLPFIQNEQWYSVDPDGNPAHLIRVTESLLEKLPPPNELSEWSKCIWSPAAQPVLVNDLH